MIKIYEIKAKSIIHKTKIPDADWGINYYHGCTHRCIYCYLKFFGRWRKQKEKWGEFVDVKINAPKLVAKESKNKEGTAILCTGGDAYQPIDKKYQLTRKVIKNLNPNLKLSILTKSDLITRDIDLFKRFKDIELGLTITCLDENIKRVFEPFSPSSYARLEALKKLKKEGFYTYVFVGPILPYLTDLEEIFKKVSPFVDLFMFEDLNLNPCRKEVLEAIKKTSLNWKIDIRIYQENFGLKKKEKLRN